MKYYNLVTKQEQNGLTPTSDDWVEVQVVINKPTDYPSNFYHTTSNKPITVRDKELSIFTDTINFDLSSVEVIQSNLRAQHKLERKASEPLSVTYKDAHFDISTNKKRDGIMGLMPSDKNVKACDACWLHLTGAEITELQVLIESTRQPIWDKEFSDNNKVAACDTHDKLKALIES